MTKKRRIIFISVWLLCAAALLIASLFAGGAQKNESIKETMRDAVLHGDNRISFFGIKDVNPAVISAFTVTGILLLVALLIRVFALPKFKTIPGKFQTAIEAAVGFFDNLAKGNSPHKNRFLGAYVFTAGTYICLGTLFELLGLQAVTTSGASISLPAPLADINGAIAMGVTSYLIILSGGIFGNGFKGFLSALKEFSLPISMSFRLFGALLSGLLVNELVYYYVGLSIALPVVVGVLFTAIHAIIQTYVLTMLTAVFYGEVSEKTEKPKKIRKDRRKEK
ncbi:MAG: F0F1 ATP synthase subunit A [Clostridia bacterium]|nr:F0F1 ATP synthase subunit A [Clostridia bacterium]